MKRFAKARDVKVGVVGYGAAFNISRTHLQDMQRAGMTPCAVAELDADRRKAAEQEFPGIETYATVAEMLKRSAVNLVAVNTPHNTHAKLGLQCLRAGRHVVCEKPMAITTAECDAMIKEAKKRNLVLSTYHNRHWDGCIMEAVKHVRKEKAIGDVFRVEAHMGGYSAPRGWWRDSKSISGGRLYDWGVHLLEYCLQIIDSEMTEVSGYAKNGFWAAKSPWKKDTSEDEAVAVVRFRNGSWLTLQMSAVESNPKRGIVEITGTRGTYVMDHGTYEIITPNGDQTVVTRGRNMNGQWEKYYANIADHLVKDKPLVITGEWARRPIQILDLANRSAKQGKALKAVYA